MKYPVVFISFDEPNADENWEHLKKLVPEAIRVHGVLGFDAAHKQAAEEALKVDPSTEYFFTVDGDNRLHPPAWRRLQQLELPADYQSHVLSWRAYNPLNGLCYGNGGLKLWPVSWVQKMKTHEASDGEVKVDFCWDEAYLQGVAVMSDTLITGSAYQAWRAGFREGAKALVTQGKVDRETTWADKDAPPMLNRAILWASLGLEVPNGAYAIAGALAGLCHSRESDVTKIIDYKNFFQEEWAKFLDLAELSPFTQPAKPEIPTLLADLRDEVAVLTGVQIPSFGPRQSKVAKLLSPRPYPSQNLLELEPWSQLNKKP